MKNDTNFNLLHPGVSVYHHRGLIVPIMACIIPFFVAKYPPFTVLEKNHHIWAALALGAFVTTVTYLCFRYVPLLRDDQYTINKSVLLGLLVSEILVFTYPRADKFADRIVSAPVLAFFLFMYLFGVSEIYKD